MNLMALVNLVALALLVWVIYQKQPVPLRKIYWPALLLKCLCGLALGWLYTRYYSTGDTISYFEDGVALARMARNDLMSYADFLWQGDHGHAFAQNLHFSKPRALFLSKLTSIFCVITADDYATITLYFSIIAFMAAWYLVKKIVVLKPELKGTAVFAFLFFPSVVFWSAGLIKESIAMAALFFLVGVFLDVWSHAKVRVGTWCLLPVAVWILWNLKYYYLAVLLPVLATALLVKLVVLPLIGQRPAVVKLAAWTLTFTVPLYVASIVHPNFYPERFLSVIVTNYEVYARMSAPEDCIQYAGLSPDASSVLQHAPKALVSVLFRPFVWETHTMLQLVASLENTLLLLLTIGACLRVKNVFQSPNRLLLFSMLVYVVLLAIFLALSTPNYGTLSRYRVGFMPFFILLICCDNPVVEKWQRLVQRWF
jgi:hypothetical protein